MWNNSILGAFRDFGKNMQLVAIFLIVSLIPGIGFIGFILVLVFKFAALNNMKFINLSLNNDLLEKFRKKMISSITRLFMALFTIISGGIFLAMGLLIPIGNLVIIGAVLLALALILVISAFVIEMKAWKDLKIFFLEENQYMASKFVMKDIIKGIDNLATGALLNALFIFGITIFIGFILQIVGYFQVAKIANMMIHVPQESEIIMANNYPTVATISSVILKQAGSANFCPMCGANLPQNGIYCAECGAKID
ncbi:MAG: hypothetical protein ACTSR7_06775 [Promethearchaeota archaeon]